MPTYRLRAARLTDNDPGSSIDNALGAAELAVAGLIGATPDQDYTGSIVSPTTHDHGYAGGAQVDHTKLANIGANTHSALDAFVASKAAASGLCDLDGSTLVPLARIPATLTGKDADTLDGEEGAAYEKIASKGVAGGYAGLDSHNFLNADVGMSSSLTNGGSAGVKEIVTAGETLAFGELIYFKAADSRWWKAKADAEATSGPVRLAVCIYPGAAGASVSILDLGYLCLSTWTWTVGAPIYLSAATAGLLTQTAPATAGQVVRIVGYGQAATIAHICIDSTYIVRS